MSSSTDRKVVSVPRNEASSHTRTSYPSGRRCVAFDRWNTESVRNLLARKRWIWTKWIKVELCFWFFNFYMHEGVRNRHLEWLAGVCQHPSDGFLFRFSGADARPSAENALGTAFAISHFSALFFAFSKSVFDTICGFSSYRKWNLVIFVAAKLEPFVAF